MFKKSTVNTEQTNLRQVEATIERLLVKRTELENSIASTQRAIEDIDVRLAGSMRSEESLTTLEAATRKSVDEKAKQEAWLSSQRKLMAGLEEEIVLAKAAVPPIEDRILLANIDECKESEAAALEALWKSIRGKIVECVAAHRRSVVASNRHGRTTGRPPQKIPEFTEIWSVLGERLLARYTAEGMAAESEAASVTSKIAMDIPSKKLTANDRHVLGDMRRTGVRSAAEILAAVKAREATQAPEEQSPRVVRESIDEWSLRVEAAEKLLAEVEARTVHFYYPKGVLPTDEHREAARRLHQETITAAQRRLEHARAALANWQKAA